MFSTEQASFLVKGQQLANILNTKVLQALGVKKSVNETKRHAYITSPPGAGKTFTVNQLAAKHNVQLIKIQGAPSMNYFITTVALAVHCFPKQEIIVWLDDSDSLFMEIDSLNVMKGALDQERNTLVWSKNLTTQISQYEASTDGGDQLRAAALRSFQKDGEVGVTIPTHNIRFIVTSNQSLTAPNSPATTARKKHEAAIRDRVKYVEFDVDAKSSWGWMASVVVDNDIMGLTKKQKFTVLNWMWQNWNHLPATSLRAVKEYAEVMLDNPGGYQAEWDMSLHGSL